MWIKILIQVISGTISGLIVVLAQKSLEKRIKKLESEEKRKNEQSEYSGLSKTLIIFKKMHIDNSKQSSFFPNDPDWREITPNGETNEDYILAFRIVKKWLRKLLIKISKRDKENSFVGVCTHKEDIVYEYLNWGEYKEILEKSKNYFKYFDNLKKDNKNIDRCCKVIFSVERINSFCSKIVAEFL